MAELHVALLDEDPHHLAESASLSEGVLSAVSEDLQAVLQKKKKRHNAEIFSKTAVL